jgi:RNA polymerase sigma factor (sigma-70 family)
MAIAPSRTDAELVRRLQGRDRTAWEELYAEYQPRLRAFGYRLTGNAHDADDLVQETFVRALPALDRLDPSTVDLQAYLFATTKNLFLKQVEKAKRAEPTAEVPEPDLPTAIEDDPERSALLRRQQDEVRVANGRLDPRQRLVLALCELEDRSYAEIGELVGLNENAVAQLVFRARERLRVELRLVQVDPESLPEECRSFLPLLAQHLDGKLRGPKLETTLAHLESCERCQAALADMREAKRRYRALLLPPLGVPAKDARAAAEDELERVGYWQGRAGRTGLLRPRGRMAVVAGAAAAALLVAGGLGAARLLADNPARQALRTGPTTTATSTTQPTVLPVTTTAPAPPPTTVVAKPKPKPKPAPPPEPKPEPKPGPPGTTTEAGETTPPTSPATGPTTAPEETVAPPTTTGKAPRRTKPSSPPPVPPTTQPPADTTAPRVSLTGGPPASGTPETAATFAFTASEPGASFACQVDGGAWQPCTSPRALHGLAVGAHSFAVRATDGAGNLGAPAAREWNVTPPPDTTAPTVTFSQTPPASSTTRTATFAFSASEPAATFACSYDGGPFAACQSPHTVTDVGVDEHSLAVRATDQAGNQGPPATASWTVVAPLPDLVATLTNTSVTVRNAGEAAANASLVTVAGVGTFSIPSLGPGQSATRTYTCRSGTVTATADYSKVVAESNEDNNTATRVVTCLGFGT